VLVAEAWSEVEAGIGVSRLGTYRNGWQCVFSQSGIAVFTDRKQYGSYKLLKSPYCTKCALSGVSEDRCTWHWKDVVARTYAMGEYLPVEREDSRSDLLSQHIRGLKRFVGYSIPLGWAMSLCIDRLYPELLKTEMIVPIPKHPDEMKADQGSGLRYNQAEELGRIIGGDIGVNVFDAVLKASPHSQRHAGWHDRVEIPEGVYTHNPEVKVRDKSILLIDDVRTSGGTASASARVLLESGAKTVNLYVAGREVLKLVGKRERGSNQD
jgi:predicted amidophosphoribosyltransferase